MIEASRGAGWGLTRGLTRMRRFGEGWEIPFAVWYLVHLAGCFIGILTAGYLAARISAGWLIACSIFCVPPVLLVYTIRKARSPDTVRKRFESDPGNLDPMTFEFDEAGLRLMAPS